jgi:hypothetical protein
VAGGHHLIPVLAAEPSVVERLRRVLVAHGARHLLHRERLTATELSEQGPAGVDDVPSVAPRRYRGDHAAALYPRAEEIACVELNAEQRDGFRQPLMPCNGDATVAATLTP